MISMSMKNKKRLAYFKENECVDTVLDMFGSVDFLEIVCRCGGSLRTYRVYGDYGEYKIYER